MPIRRESDTVEPGRRDHLLRLGRRQLVVPVGQVEPSRFVVAAPTLALALIVEVTVVAGAALITTFVNVTAPANW